MPKPEKFSTYLKTRAKRIKDPRNGKRTRLFFMASAARLLEKKTMFELSVAEIRKPMNTSHGTFYIYFKDKYDLVNQLLTEYIEFELASMPQMGSNADLFDFSLAINSWYAECFRLNTGIMRCFFQLNNARPDMAELWAQRSRKIVSRIMEFYTQKFELSHKEIDVFRHTLHIQGSALDQILSGTYGATAHSVLSSKEDLAETLDLYGVMMHRAMFCKNPSTKKLSKSKILIQTKFKKR